MSRPRRTHERLLLGVLRLYPHTWRERYSDELAELTAAQLADANRMGRVRIWFNVIRCGAAIRIRGLGSEANPEVVQQRARSGLFAVISAWTAFVFAGLMLAKLSEPWASGVPGTDTRIAKLAMDAVMATAVIVGSVLIAGIAIAIPTMIKQTRGATLRLIKRPLSVALITSAIAVVFMVGLVVWAHSLNDAARNGSNNGYSIAALTVAFTIAVTLAAWCWTGITLGRHVTLDHQMQVTENVVATVAALGMVTMTACSAAWWLSVSRAAARALDPTAIDPIAFATVMALMGLAAALSCVGSFTAIRFARTAS